MDKFASNQSKLVSNQQKLRNQQPNLHQITLSWYNIRAINDEVRFKINQNYRNSAIITQICMKVTLSNFVETEQSLKLSSNQNYDQIYRDSTIINQNLHQMTILSNSLKKKTQQSSTKFASKSTKAEQKLVMKFHISNLESETQATLPAQKM